MNEQRMAALARQIDLDGRVVVLEEAHDANGEWFLVVALLGVLGAEEQWEIRSLTDWEHLKQQLSGTHGDDARGG